MSAVEIRSIGPPPELHADRVIALMLRQAAEEHATLIDTTAEIVGSSSSGTPRAQAKLLDRIERHNNRPNQQDDPTWTWIHVSVATIIVVQILVTSPLLILQSEGVRFGVIALAAYVVKEVTAAWSHRKGGKSEPQREEGKAAH
jgi:hypothetical protein